MSPLLRDESAAVHFVMPVMEGDWKLRGRFPFLMSGKWSYSAHRFNRLITCSTILPRNLLQLLHIDSIQHGIVWQTEDFIWHQVPPGGRLTGFSFHSVQVILWLWGSFRLH